MAFPSLPSYFASIFVLLKDVKPWDQTASHSPLFYLRNSNFISGDITLEGANAGVDRGHVYFNGRPLCAEGGNRTTTWDINASNVVCKMLGFSGASTFTTDGCTYGGCPEGVPFALSGFRCTGNEAHILKCPRDQTIPSNCGQSGTTGQYHHDFVGVECTGVY